MGGAVDFGLKSNGGHMSDLSRDEINKIVDVFMLKHESLMQTITTFTSESTERENQLLKEVQEIHKATVDLLQSYSEAAIERNEAVIKSAKRSAQINLKSAKILIGTGLLIAATVLILAYSDPQDVADTLKRFFPAIATAWGGLIGYLLYDKKPPMGETDESSTRNPQRNVEDSGSN